MSFNTNTQLWAKSNEGTSRTVVLSSVCEKKWHTHTHQRSQQYLHTQKMMKIIKDIQKSLKKTMKTKEPISSELKWHKPFFFFCCLLTDCCFYNILLGLSLSTFLLIWPHAFFLASFIAFHQLCISLELFVGFYWHLIWLLLLFVVVGTLWSRWSEQDKIEKVRPLLSNLPFLCKVINETVIYGIRFVSLLFASKS